jgi:transposase-like protein
MRRRQFTKEFKLGVLHEIEAGLSLAEASRRYEVHPNLIRKW